MFASFVIIIGIAICGFTVATFSSAMTVSHLHDPAIIGPGDLAARPVAVIAGTRDHLPGRRARHAARSVGSIGEAVALLKGGPVDAVVHDTPLLRYYLKNNPDSRLALAPQTFEIFTYGITYPKGSPWREKLDLLLVKTLEGGAYEEMHARWFGCGSELLAGLGGMGCFFGAGFRCWRV